MPQNKSPEAQLKLIAEIGKEFTKKITASIPPQLKEELDKVMGEQFKKQLHKPKIPKFIRKQRAEKERIDNRSALFFDNFCMFPVEVLDYLKHHQFNPFLTREDKELILQHPTENNRACDERFIAAFYRNKFSQSEYNALENAIHFLTKIKPQKDENNPSVPLSPNDSNEQLLHETTMPESNMPDSREEHQG